MLQQSSGVLFYNNAAIPANKYCLTLVLSCKIKTNVNVQLIHKEEEEYIVTVICF